MTIEEFQFEGHVFELEEGGLRFSGIHSTTAEMLFRDCQAWGLVQSGGTEADLNVAIVAE